MPPYAHYGTRFNERRHVLEENARESAHGNAAPYVWASVRIALGVIFFWAFIDKVWGLGYSTKPENAWIAGGNPTLGYLNSSVGPFADFFKAMAGDPITNLLFMGGLAAIGAALLTGIGVRIAAYGGALMMSFMYLSHVPWAGTTTNPIVDDHVVYGLLLVGLTFVHAGRRLGLGGWWGTTSLVRRHPILE